MLTKITAIVLTTIRHSDRFNIIRLFTLEQGLISCLTPAGGGRSGKMRHARLMPMAMISAEINFKGNNPSSLPYLSNVDTPVVWHDIYFNPMKSAMALFMAELMGALLRGTESDPPLWQFTLRALRFLDSPRGENPNFHLAFMISMMPYLGISPDIRAYSPDGFFDMQAGEFINHTPFHRNFITGIEMQAIPSLARMTFRTMHLFKFRVEQRRRLLDHLLRYYALHLPLNSSLKSLQVLRELME